MDTSRFRAAGAGPPGPRTSSADGPARLHHDVGNAAYSIEAAPLRIAGRRRVPAAPAARSLREGLLELG